MTISTIRRRLHHYLEIADDKKVKAIYTMVENEIAESDVSYSKTFKAALDRRQAAYKKHPSTAFSPTESKQRIQNKMAYYRSRSCRTE